MESWPTFQEFGLDPPGLGPRVTSLMATWKSDPLIQVVFAEVQALWDDLDHPERPLLLRVEERTPATWGGSPSTGGLRNVWIFDDHGARLAPILRHEDHEFGPPHGEFSRYGLVQFAVRRNSAELALRYHLGPSIAGEIHYGIERDGDDLWLLAHSGTLAV